MGAACLAGDHSARACTARAPRHRASHVTARPPSPRAPHHRAPPVTARPASLRAPSHGRGPSAAPGRARSCLPCSTPCGAAGMLRSCGQAPALPCGRGCPAGGAPAGGRQAFMRQPRPQRNVVSCRDAGKGARRRTAARMPAPVAQRLPPSPGSALRCVQGAGLIRSCNPLPRLLALAPPGLSSVSEIWCRISPAQRPQPRHGLPRLSRGWARTRWCAGRGAGWWSTRPRSGGAAAGKGGIG
jgi:hypothetical protein